MAILHISIEDARAKAKRMKDLLDEIEGTLGEVTSEMANIENVYKGEAAGRARNQYEVLKNQQYPKFKEAISSMSDKLAYATRMHEETEEKVTAEANKL